MYSSESLAIQCCGRRRFWRRMLLRRRCSAGLRAHACGQGFCSAYRCNGHDRLDAFLVGHRPSLTARFL